MRIDGEVEQEPSPDLLRPALEKRVATAATGAPASAFASNDVGGAGGNAKPCLRLLLEHAFGAQMLEGRDEWRDVADVIRSSFFVVAKELKRHDKRLCAVEANNHHHIQQLQFQAGKEKQEQQEKESEAETRWRVLQAQMALFGDELQLLARQLQQLKESHVSGHEQLMRKNDFEFEKSCQRTEERHARVKKRLASLDAKTKRVVERANSTQSAVRSMASQLGAVATETRGLTLKINDRLAPRFGALEEQLTEFRLLLSSAPKAEPSVPSSTTCNSVAPARDSLPRNKIVELFPVQTQLKHEIQRLQHALVAHDQRVMAQAKEIKRCVAKMTRTGGNVAPNSGAFVKGQTKQQSDEVMARDSPPLSRRKEERKAELPIQGILVTDSESRQPSAPYVAPIPVSESHATLKQRFAQARQKQQESLDQLRQQHQQQQR